VKTETLVTKFRAQVYAATRKIPRGSVTTYALLAKAIGCGSPRAVGQALRHNPFAPEVPCHRVIRRDLTIGGFNGATDGPLIRKKLRLLREEGVEFQEGRLREAKRIWKF
jgi:methylated-DNA-[protein]-cysteine S-methyltransferase